MRHTINRIVMIRIRLFRLTSKRSTPHAITRRIRRPSFNGPVSLINRHFTDPQTRHLCSAPPLTGRLVRIHTQRQKTRFKVLSGRSFSSFGVAFLGHCNATFRSDTIYRIRKHFSTHRIATCLVINHANIDRKRSNRPKVLTFTPNLFSSTRRRVHNNRLRRHNPLKPIQVTSSRVRPSRHIEVNVQFITHISRQAQTHNNQ